MMRAAMLWALMMAAGASASLLPTPATAQAAGSPQARDFVQAAAESDAFERAEAQSALAESRDPQVRAFARMMIRDHDRTGATLAAATAEAGLMPPPPGISAGQAPFLAALQSERGAAFDRTYWHQQALAHRAALITQRDYATTGDVPALRGAAAAAVPVIQAHLAIAERMEGAVPPQ